MLVYSIQIDKWIVFCLVCVLWNTTIRAKAGDFVLWILYYWIFYLYNRQVCLAVYCHNEGKLFSG